MNKRQPQRENQAKIFALFNHVTAPIAATQPTTPEAKNSTRIHWFMNDIFDVELL